MSAYSGQPLRDRTFATIAAAYFARRGPRLKGLAIDLNRYHKHLEPMFGKKRVSAINQRMVASLCQSLAAMRPATIWNVLELLRRIVNFGARHRLCRPLAFVLEMPARDNEVIEHLTAGQRASLLRTLRDWPDRNLAHMLLLAYLTGMRRGEIFRLQDSDLDLEFGLLRLRDPKGGKTMTIGIGRKVRDVLREQISLRDAANPGSPYIFPNRRGGQRRECRVPDSLRQSAGLPEGFRPFHGLRHNFAVSLANSGKFGIDLISEMLTHKNIEFTRRKYARFLPDTLRAASDAAAGILLDGEER